MKNKKLIKLIYGIGNEGDQFKETRHNIGKEIVNNFIKNPEILKFAYFENYNNLILASNKGFINESGKGVKELCLKLKIKPEEILIIHDDADIIFPFFKISFGASSAGHKGIDSIIRNLKTKNFWRFRVGIQQRKRLKAQEIVLKKFSKKEKEIVKRIKEKFKIILDLLTKRMPNELNISKEYFLN